MMYLLKLLKYLLAMVLSGLIAYGTFVTPGTVQEVTAKTAPAPAPLMEAEESYETGLMLAMDTAPGSAGGGMYGGMEPVPQDAYAPLSDPGFVATATSPLSTFAADVDTAAYANVRRMVMDQRFINPDAVRLEELINAFSYGDPAPQDGEILAIHTQVAACPWNQAHQLLRVNLKTAPIDTDDLPPSNLVFLIDTSGSMEGADRLGLVRRSFALLTGQLTEKDRVSIVTYAGSAHVVLDGARGDETATILAAIDELAAGGGTHGADGIATAYALADKYAAPGVNSRVILATDGDFNIGVSTEAELTRMIEAQKEAGTFLTVLGFGYGNLKDNTLQALADHGNGTAAYIDTIHEARRALVDEMGATLVTVAKDVKLQVEFNPSVVEGYRLIGYENRRLQDQDFADDTKDGGEMGAGHSVTALYELIPAGAGELAAPELSYQKTDLTGSDEFATVHVRYKAPDGDTSTELTHPVAAGDFTDAPDEDFTLSAAVAAWGQRLMGSEFAGDADTQMILEMLQPMLSGDEGGRIVELANLVRLSEGLSVAEGES